MTTVGYGDVLPTTAETKVLAMVLMLVGIGSVAILTGAIAERFFAQDVAHEGEQIEGEVDETSEAILRELRDLRVRLGNLEAAVQRRHSG